MPITYYRLKQIDYDGKFEYSRMIAVRKDRSGISIYPNPAADQFFVKDIEKEENVIIRNLDGRVILEQKVMPKSPVNVSSFSSGLYIITVGEETRKVAIRK